MSIFVKILKFLGIVLAGIILLLLVAEIIVDPIAKNIMEKQINEADQGQYSAQIDNVDISLLWGNVVLNGVRIQTDTAVARENETPVIDFKAKELAIMGLSYFSYLLSDKVEIAEVVMLDLVVGAKVRTIGDEEAGPFSWEDLDIYPIIKGQVDRVRLRDITFRNIDLTLVNIDTKDTLFFDAEQFHVNTDDLLIDANRVFTDGRAFFASRIDIDGKDVRVNRSGLSPYTLSLDVIEFETRESDFSMLSEKVYFLKKGTSIQDTVLFVFADKFEVNELGLTKVKEDSVALIKSVLLDGMKVVNNFEIIEKEVEQADTESIDLAKFALGKYLPEMLDKVEVTTISLQNIDYRQKKDIAVLGIGFESRNMVIDKTPAFSDERFLHAEKFKFSIDTLSFFEPEQKMQIGFSDLKLDMENGVGEFGLKNIKAKHTERRHGEMFAMAELRGFNITGIDTRGLDEKIFTIDSISIEYPQLYVDLGGMANGEGQEADASRDDLDFYPAIEEYLKEFRINKIALIKANISVEGLEENGETVRLPAVYAQVSDFHIAEGNAFAGNRLLHAYDIALRIERIDFPLVDKVHRVKLDLLNVNTLQGFLRADGFHFDYNENYPKIMEGPETNMVFKAQNEKFQIEGLDFSKALSQEGVFADAITIDGLNVEVFLDNNYPAEESDVVLPATIQMMIKEVEMPIYLGDLSLKNAHITYEELAEGGEKPGVFTFEKLSVNLANLTNVEERIAENSETQISVNADLMGEGYFQAKLIIPMHDELAKVNFSGDIDSLDLVALNRYTEYTSLFGFESGMIYTLKWDFNAGSDLSEGVFGLSYENLNIQLSESDSPAPANVFYQIGGYLANALVIDEDKSEDKSEPPKEVDFDRQKEEGESFIDHYIASLLAGFVEFMGFPWSIIDP